MPPRSRHHSGLLPGVVLAALAGPIGLAGQDVQLQRDYPGEGPYVCPQPLAPVTAEADQRARAGQLASDAVQAQILGDAQGARELLQRASEADPESPDVAYQHARVLEDLGLPNEAILEYCRALSLSSWEGTFADGRERLDALYDVIRERISQTARQAFIFGLDEADRGLLESSVASFSLSIEDAPEWPSPVFNRAVVLERLGRVQESLADYRRYLRMMPNEIDPVAALVSERIGTLEAIAAATTPSPTGALALGVLPGMGHYYTGRPVVGTLVLGLAGGAIATGLMVKSVTVTCVNQPPSGQSCAPTDVHDRSVERPYLLPSLGVAATVTIVGAIDALVKARRHRREIQALTGDTTASGPRLRLPSVSARNAQVDLNLLRVTFR